MVSFEDSTKRTFGWECLKCGKRFELKPHDVWLLSPGSYFRELIRTSESRKKMAEELMGKVLFVEDEVPEHERGE